MPPLSRILEVFVYALLNFMPFLVLALYPFRHSLRFSYGVTGALVGALTLVQLVLAFWAAFYANGRAGLISMVSTLLYAAFYFLAVKKHFGKTLFTLMVISNLANLAVIAAKCLEGHFFPELALENYRWSFSLMLFLVEGILGVPLYFAFRYIFTPAMEREPSGFEWRYLWLVPATFYVIWYYSFYANATMSSLEVALAPGSTLFLLAVNIGAFLIYYIVTRMISERAKALELQERNHLLTTQAMQYEALQEKIAEARRVKHDVRHHIAVMQEYLARQDYAALTDYLNQYGRSLPNDAYVRFCENSAANAVLLYFAQQAKSAGIDYIVKAVIPQDLPVQETDLTVILGNLLENALTACQREKNARLIFRADTDAAALCITVDNTFTGQLKHIPGGGLASTKHAGAGLGTRSVESIVSAYGGVCRLEVRDAMFCASVLLPISKKEG